MSTLTKRPRRVKPVGPCPPLAWQWIAKPLWPCELLPAGLAGMLLVNDCCYMVTVLAERDAAGDAQTEGFRLTKADGSIYDLPATCDGCDCPDGTFRSERPMGCKHAVALRAALRSIGFDVQDPKPRSAGAFTRQELADAEAVAVGKWGSRGGITLADLADPEPGELRYEDDGPDWAA